MKRVAWVTVAGSACALGVFLLWARRDTPPAIPSPELEVRSTADAPEPRDPSSPAEPPRRAARPDVRESPYATEEAYLRDLEALRQQDKEAALALAREGAAWYPNQGVLAEARKALLATLLVDLGRMAEARVEVRRFLQEHPESRYRPMLQGMTGIHPRPGPPPSVEP
jgi:hypothetical protein